VEDQVRDHGGRSQRRERKGREEGRNSALEHIVEKETVGASRE
jgi:hypothetical protein